MKDFRNLKVWEKSHKLVLNIYKSTSSFSKEEIYGLTSQMRRSSSSIPSNISEGCGRNTQPQFARFLNIAFSPASELEYQLILAKDLGYINKNTFKELLSKTTEIKRMIKFVMQEGTS